MKTEEIIERLWVIYGDLRQKSYSDHGIVAYGFDKNITALIDDLKKELEKQNSPPQEEKPQWMVELDRIASSQQGFVNVTVNSECGCIREVDSNSKTRYITCDLHKDSDQKQEKHVCCESYAPCKNHYDACIRASCERINNDPRNRMTIPEEKHDGGAPCSINEAFDRVAEANKASFEPNKGKIRFKWSGNTYEIENKDYQIWKFHDSSFVFKMSSETEKTWCGFRITDRESIKAIHVIELFCQRLRASLDTSMFNDFIKCVPEILSD